MFVRRLLLAFGFLLVAALSARAQRLTISRVDTSGYPTIRAWIYTLDAGGAPIAGLGPADFALTENGTPRAIESVSCPTPRPVEAISSVLTIDVSGSMASAAPEGTSPNIELARAAAEAWVAGLPEGAAECAISTFDDRSLINRDFTSDRESLRGAIAALQPQGGTSYDAGLIGSPAGGITIASAGRWKRVVVFLTDGRGGGNENAIVEEAAKNGVTIFCVTLGMPAPEILKRIAHRTGGEYFENVTSVTEATGIYRTILYRALGGEPCEIVWRSEPQCAPARVVELAIPARSLRSPIEYAAPHASIARLDLDAPSLIFGRVPAGGTKELSVTLTAPAGPITVRALEPAGAHAAFTLTGASLPFTVAPGERKTITVRYAATDTTFRAARWRIVSDACIGSTIFASAGSSGRPDPTIRLLRPNGGEVFRAGDMATIAWEGIPPGDTVRLDYSTDAGATWRPIAPAAITPEYRWSVPATPSDRCLARVMQVDRATLAAPPMRKAGSKIFAISPDGQRVAGALGEREDTIVIWSTGDGRELWRFSERLDRFDGMSGMVESLEFTPDGNSLIAESHGEKSYLIDVGRRRVERTFEGTLLNMLNFRNSSDNVTPLSPDGGRILLQGRRDLIPEVVELRSGRTIARLATEPGSVLGASFTADGAGVITVDGDGAARLWDAASGALLRTLRHDRARVATAVGSPDGSLIATTAGDPDDSVRFWDRATGALVARRRMGDDADDHIARFTPDGSAVLLLPDDVPTLVDARSGVVLQRFTNAPPRAMRTRPTAPMAATFSPDGSLLATYGFAGVIVWDVATGIVVREFPHSGNTIGMRARFTPDGSALVWSFGEDVEIGAIDPAAIQEDRSDALWSIVADGRAVARDVDFGRKAVGSTTDSTVAAYIRNEGSAPLRVDAITITGADAGEFALVSGIPPFEIPAGSARPVELRFAPSLAARRSAVVEIAAGGRTLRQAVTGEGMRPQLRIEAAAIDFGARPVGSMNDTTVAAILRNTGTTPILLRPALLIGPDTAQFSVEGSGGVTTLAPGEIFTMTVRFHPERAGRTSSRLLFEHDGIGGRTLVELHGRGIASEVVERYPDPTTFRTIAVPNAIVPKGGTIVGGSYDLLGLMAGYAVTDNVMLLAGGAVPLPDDWGGANGNMYGAWSLGAKGGMAIGDRLNVAAGFQWGMSIYDQEATPDAVESTISVAVPYGAVSWGDDDSRVSLTLGWAFKRHETPADRFDRQAGIVALGGDYRFADRWKVAAEIMSMKTLGYIPVAATVRWFGRTWALDAGLAWLGIGNAPSLPIAPVVSWVAVW